LSTDYDTANGGSLIIDPVGVAGTRTTVGAAAVASTGVTTSTALTGQYVTGNGTASPLAIATYNVKATSNIGGAYVRTMTFAGVNGTITAVTAGGITQPMSSNAATITLPGNGIAVPANASGVNIPVTATLACVGADCSATANTAVSLALTKITYYNGSAIVCDGAACAASGSNDTAALTAATATTSDYLVSTVPTVSMTTTNAPTSLVLGTQQIGTFTVAAGSTGDIKVRTIPFSVTVGGTTASITAGSITLYDASGNTLDNAPTTTGDGGGIGTITGTFAFSPSYSIPANTSKTFSVYATVAGTLGTAATSSTTFTLSPKASFLWDDVTGNVTSATGTYIYGYPTGTQSKSN